MIGAVCCAQRPDQDVDEHGRPGRLPVGSQGDQRKLALDPALVRAAQTVEDLHERRMAGGSETPGQGEIDRRVLRRTEEPSQARIRGLQAPVVTAEETDLDRKPLDQPGQTGLALRDRPVLLRRAQAKRLALGDLDDDGADREDLAIRVPDREIVGGPAAPHARCRRRLAGYENAADRHAGIQHTPHVATQRVVQIGRGVRDAATEHCLDRQSDHVREGRIQAQIAQFSVQQTHAHGGVEEGRERSRGHACIRAGGS